MESLFFHLIYDSLEGRVRNHNTCYCKARRAVSLRHKWKPEARTTIMIIWLNWAKIKLLNYFSFYVNGELNIDSGICPTNYKVFSMNKC